MSPESEDTDEIDEVENVSRTTRSGRAFGLMQSRKKRLRQEAIDDPDMEVEDEGDEEEDEDEDEKSFEAGECPAPGHTCGANLDQTETFRTQPSRH